MSVFGVRSPLRRLLPFLLVTLGIGLLCATFTAGSVHASEPPAVAASLHTSQIAPSSVLTGAAGLYLPVIVATEPGPPTCSTVPTLLEPANGAQLDTLIPVFKWAFSGNSLATGLRLELSMSPQFEIPNTYNTGPTSGEMSFATNRRADMTYYWRMRVYCNDQEGPYTATHTFRTPASGVIPLPPQLSEPADGASITGPVTFRWQPVEGATAYTLYYRQPDSLAFIAPAGSGTSVTLQLPSGTYEWWLRSRNGYAHSPESDHRQLTVK